MDGKEVFIWNDLNTVEELESRQASAVRARVQQRLSAVRLAMSGELNLAQIARRWAEPAGAVSLVPRKPPPGKDPATG